jgi:hypothetical protein
VMWGAEKPPIFASLFHDFALLGGMVSRPAVKTDGGGVLAGGGVAAPLPRWGAPAPLDSTAC